MALKRVHVGSFVNEQVKQQVMREAQFMQELPSTHFVQCYHSFFEDRKHLGWYFYLVMEHASNGDLLNNLIKKTR